MSGLRSKSRQRRETAILEASARLFKKHGYVKTSIAEIADAAEVSIGSIYAYFGSKGGITRKLMEPLQQQVEAQAARVINNPPADAVEATLKVYEALRFTEEWADPKLLEVLDATLPHDDELRELLVKETRALVDRVFRQLLSSLLDNGSIRPDLPLDDAAFLLANLLEAEFNIYVGSSGAVSYDALKRQITVRARLLLEAWTPPAP